MKKIIVIGNGLSAWTVTNSLSEENFNIKVIGKKTINEGALQLSPNGMNALQNLLNKKKITDKISNLTELNINSIILKKIKILKKFYFSKYDLKYHSISRNNLIQLLKNNVLDKDNIKYIDQECVEIIKKKNKYSILLANKNVCDADIIIGTDGINGITRKCVCGKSDLITKRVYRGISEDYKSFYLSKGILKINFSKYGHIVSYPFFENKNKFLNNVFIPNKKYQSDQNVIEKVIQISDCFQLKWDESFYSFDKENNQKLFKNNIYLFGEAAFTFEPHLAQVGNTILEDGFYLKYFLNKNKLSLKIAFKYLFDKRLEKKRNLKKIAHLFGRIFGFNNSLALMRDYAISKIPDKIIYNFFKEIWKNEFEI